MNLGIESETLEFKKTTGEIDKAMDNIASMLNKHGHGTLYFGVNNEKMTIVMLQLMPNNRKIYSQIAERIIAK